MRVHEPHVSSEIRSLILLGDCGSEFASHQQDVPPGSSIASVGLKHRLLLDFHALTRRQNVDLRPFPFRQTRKFFRVTKKRGESPVVNRHYSFRVQELYGFCGILWSQYEMFAYRQKREVNGDIVADQT